MLIMWESSTRPLSNPFPINLLVRHILTPGRSLHPGPPSLQKHPHPCAQVPWLHFLPHCSVFFLHPGAGHLPLSEDKSILPGLENHPSASARRLDVSVQATSRQVGKTKVTPHTHIPCPPREQWLMQPLRTRHEEPGTLSSPTPSTLTWPSSK